MSDCPSAPFAAPEAPDGTPVLDPVLDTRTGHPYGKRRDAG